ncbi:RNA chaperone ProQ [Paraburkholderia ultramafica]|uniref:RNA chaperone ProQ n=1 Tax=Paraburkholderia ultramafica TaxID=1544867 RepID=A0A6S7AWR8_9BURK|nr:ProQ/FinO family protein [Paraburkholderia ultramafica]CAB3780212.1 RNA chaperone ProQ [Paraburkholderia ultramafica]
MGFEQLAELKKQLAAARAGAAPAAKSGGKPASKADSKPASKADSKAASRPDARPARKPAQPNRAAPAAAAQAKPAVDAKPVDPVVKSIGRLQKRFPIAFPKNPAPKLPLKVGIFEDLVVHAKELSLSEAELRDAIKTWCRGSRYWKCLVEGAARVDLTGAEAGLVTAQEAAGAQRLQAHRAGKGAPKATAAAAADAPAAEAASASADVAASAPDESGSKPQASATGPFANSEAVVAEPASSPVTPAAAPEA